MQTIDFEVTGDQKMQCAGCETRVAYALRQLPGVREVRASAKTQRVLVLFDGASAAGVEQVEQMLKQLGYEAQRIGGAA